MIIKFLIIELKFTYIWKTTYSIKILEMLLRFYLIHTHTHIYLERERERFFIKYFSDGYILHSSLIFFNSMQVVRLRWKFFIMELGFFNSVFHTCKASSLLFEEHLQSFLLWCIWRWGSHKIFACAGLEPQSSRSQPPKQLRLHAWVISTGSRSL
jgi:hypothetical protein